MSVNPDDMNMTGAPAEYVDLEHQVIRQKLDVSPESDTGATAEALPGDPYAEFDPGERQLDREEIAQLVYYRRFASINFLQMADTIGVGEDVFAIVDASVGINGDLFRPVTTQESFITEPDGETVFVDTGGEIGLLDNYQIYAQPNIVDPNHAAGGIAQISEFDIDYYNWPTGGPIVDSFDTITCGFGFGMSDNNVNAGSEVQVELRYDFYWDVREQGRSTNPFGRPSTR